LTYVQVERYNGPMDHDELKGSTMDELTAYADLFAEVDAELAAAGKTEAIDLALSITDPEEVAS